MSRAIERRLAAAERRLTQTQVGLRVIAISGGLPGPIRYAQGGGRIWKRANDETFEAFEARVTADAKAAHLKQVVIGGLPPAGAEAGTLEGFLRRFDFPEAPPEEPI
jgi:hypothetical protein